MRHESIRRSEKPELGWLQEQQARGECGVAMSVDGGWLRTRAAERTDGLQEYQMITIII
jgi:hypothetical protein